MSLAVVTMVYDDYEFLPIWLRYWSKYVDQKSIYVIIHGTNRRLHRMAQGCNITEIRRPMPYPRMEADRWQMLGHFVSALSFMHEAVVYTDVDEIITLDPCLDMGIVDYILTSKSDVIAPFGVEIVHREDKEPENYDPDYSVLDQRRFLRINASHGKPSIVKQPIAWRRGGHFAYCEDVNVDTRLTTFHLRFFDMQLFRDRAVRRRNTTQAPRGKNNTPARAWRASDSGIDSTIASLQNMPFGEHLPDDRSEYLEAINRSKIQVTKNGQIFIKHALPKSKKLYKLPDRYMNLF